MKSRFSRFAATGRVCVEQQRRKRAAPSCQFQRDADSRRIRKNSGKRCADQAINERPLIGFFNMRPRMIDQMHIVDARRAGGHAGKAGQAAINMRDGDRVGGAVVFQHVLDEVNPPARRIQLIAQRHIGRASRGAKAAMDAGAENGFGLGDGRVGELGEGEGGLHL